jgi:glutamate racemase
MQTQAPVGVFDSGVGGLATLKALMRSLPGEDFIYFGDNANAPYGILDEEEIRALTFKCMDFLIGLGAKCVVIACNTASSAAVQAVRERYSLPVVAMEPAVRPAAAALSQGKALVMATPATLKQKLYRARIEECGVKERMLPLPCPKLVELVEQGIVEGNEIDAAIQGYFTPYRDEMIDAVVLGCTHYLHIREQIEHLAKILWPKVVFIDGDEGTAHQLERVLDKHNQRNPRQSGGTATYYTSGDPDFYLPLFEKLMGRR